MNRILAITVDRTTKDNKDGFGVNIEMNKEDFEDPQTLMQQIIEETISMVMLGYLAKHGELKKGVEA